jgi:paraquat-inducible protein B
MNESAKDLEVQGGEAQDADAPGVVARVAGAGGGLNFSKVWLVPIVALVIGLWMTYSHYAGQGPIIELTFQSGEGIQAGTTKVRRKNVEIGEVLDLRLSEDADEVVLSVRIYDHARQLLREDSQFWVVRPRIGVGGISGLSTLLSGAYIEMSPGSEDVLADEFAGLETPPVTPLGTPGLHVTLDSAGAQALQEGDPILFQGIEVGRIESAEFDNQKRRSYYNAFIAAPYDEMVTENTRFWFNSGLSVELSADGIRFDIASPSTVLAGGVAFDVPEGLPLGERITERAYFTLYPNESASREFYYDNALSFVILFEDSIRGLRPGAPVEYRGVKVGEVVRTDIDYHDIDNLLEPDSRIPVLIDIVPARLGYEDDYAVLDDVDERVNELIDDGLTAGLAMGNLLTGQKYIELQYYGDGFGKSETFAGYTVIPSIDGQLDQLMTNASNAMQTINQLPLAELVDSAEIAMDEIAATLAEFRKSASDLDEILSDPAAHEMMGTLNAALTSFQQLASDFSEGSATNVELQKSLQSLARALNELEPVLRNIRRNPNSLIFGVSEEPDLEPKGERE